ncbi:MAG: 16S rRNA (uracil(1498)-N(3))-methyltransferase [Gammaproteobacteria bacterium]
MRTPRIFVDPPLAAHQALRLEAPASRHLLTVLRLKPGAALILFDGAGHEFDARLEAIEGKPIRALVGTARANGNESPLHITLAQAISRGERMDYTVQKAVELSVAEIIPLLTARSVVRLDAEQAARKCEHWQQLTIHACEQSGRACVPKMQTPVTPTELLAARPRSELRLLLDPAAGSALDAVRTPPESILLLVGPEGGLDEAELEQATAAGFQSLRLGPRVRHTETAALVALSVLQARWGDLAAAERVPLEDCSRRRTRLMGGAPLRQRFE